MVFETIRCVDGVALNLSYHQYRLDHTSNRLGFSRSFDLQTLIIPPKEGIYRCRCLYSDSDYTIEYIPYLPRSFTSLKLVHDDTIEYPLKYSDRAHLHRLAQQHTSSSDILIVKKGLLTDTTIANIALFINGEWLTPESPLLEGTTRARLIDDGFLKKAPLTPADIQKADRFALLNAMVGFLEVENGIIF